MRMYHSCVKGMIKNGIDQWDESYPNIEIIQEDLRANTYYVAEINSQIIGGINIDRNQDPTYLNISWQDKSNLFLIVISDLYGLVNFRSFPTTLIFE